MFYTFMQNNSGGNFCTDEKAGIGTTVIIEADTAEQANSIAEDKGIYFNGCDTGEDCPCCGDRWHPASNTDGTETPSLYGEPIEKQEAGPFRKDAYIHRLSGEIEYFIFKQA